MTKYIVFMCLFPIIIYAETKENENIKTLSKNSLVVSSDIVNEQIASDDLKMLYLNIPVSTKDPLLVPSSDTVNELMSGFNGVWKSSVIDGSSNSDGEPSGYYKVTGSLCSESHIDKFKEANRPDLTGVGNDDLANYTCGVFDLAILDVATDEQILGAFQGSFYFLVDIKTGFYMNMMLNNKETSDQDLEYISYSFTTGYLKKVDSDTQLLLEPNLSYEEYIATVPVYLDNGPVSSDIVGTKVIKRQVHEALNMVEGEGKFNRTVLIDNNKVTVTTKKVEKWDNLDPKFIDVSDIFALDPHGIFTKVE